MKKVQLACNKLNKEKKALRNENYQGAGQQIIRKVQNGHWYKKVPKV